VSEGSIDTSLLGAYIDGELDVVDSARIAEAVARDPEVARQVMVLTRLKSATAASVEDVSFDLPVRSPRRPWVYGIAACLLIALLGAGAYWFGNFGTPGRGGNQDFAGAAHSSWSNAALSDVVDPSVVLTAAPAVLAHAYVPDLSSAKLRLVHSAIVQGRSGPALVAGYTGTRGCRVTLLATVAGGADETSFSISESTGVIRARWRAGSLDYAMLAKGMARKRFHLLATSVFEASLERVPMDQDARHALARSRAESKPCMLS
jgi:anti-sigma factor RsiW